MVAASKTTTEDAKPDEMAAMDQDQAKYRSESEESSHIHTAAALSFYTLATHGSTADMQSPAADKFPQTLEAVALRSENSRQFAEPRTS